MNNENLLFLYFKKCILFQVFKIYIILYALHLHVELWEKLSNENIWERSQFLENFFIKFEKQENFQGSKISTEIKKFEIFINFSEGYKVLEHYENNFEGQNYW